MKSSRCKELTDEGKPGRFKIVVKDDPDDPMDRPMCTCENGHPDEQQARACCETRRTLAAEFPE